MLKCNQSSIIQTGRLVEGTKRSEIKILASVEKVGIYRKIKRSQHQSLKLEWQADHINPALHH